jgi:HEAT repeat protein
MAKIDEYRLALRQLDEWEPFLLQHSGLPGPRGNLELAAAVVEEADEASLRFWAALDASDAPFGSAEEFLPVCGVIGLGRLLAEGDASILPELHRLAADPRWRIREAVAMALQRFGDADLPALLA